MPSIEQLGWVSRWKSVRFRPPLSAQLPGIYSIASITIDGDLILKGGLGPFRAQYFEVVELKAGPIPEPSRPTLRDRARALINRARTEPIAPEPMAPMQEVKRPLSEPQEPKAPQKQSVRVIEFDE